MLTTLTGRRAWQSNKSMVREDTKFADAEFTGTAWCGAGRRSASS